jgi:intracellular multiplication protein IcmO
MPINPNHEIDPSRLTRDTRTAEQRFFATLFKPANFRLYLVALIVLQLYLPALWPVWAVVVWVFTLSFQDQKFRMPLRMPKDVGGLDQTDWTEHRHEDSFFFGWFKQSRAVRKLAMAGGILYLGYLRSPLPEEHGRELWLNDSDARTHLFLAGTTGSGKTKALCGIAYNALCWGSGVAFGDGKASVALPYAMWSMCRRFGREDDFLVCNYLTGGVDPFQRLVEQEKGMATTAQPTLAQSNSANAFSEGGADFLLQLMASLLHKASGDGAQWQQKALNMMDALLRTLCYKRARGELALSISVIRHYLALQNLVQLYIEGREGKLPEAAFLPIKAYFETGLPGFNPDLAYEPARWDAEVLNQHGYLTGQFSRTLSMMMDTYGHIFLDKYPEIDPLDVLLNNRVLVVLIPSLEKSAAEAAALGKLYTSTQRLMMAQTLGYQIEGSKGEVLDARPSNRPNPYIIINDELAYWFSEGLAVMFAQARELGFMMVAAVQDVQGLKRAAAGDEAASVIANTKIKWTLALEDPEDTFDLLRKSGGEGHYSMLSGHDAVSGTFASGNTAQDTSSIQKRDRVTLEELKSLNPGEGVVMFKKSVLPSASFYLPDEQLFTTQLQPRINRFLQVESPAMKRLPASARPLSSKNQTAQVIVAQLREGKKPYFPELDDPVLEAVRVAATHMNQMERFEVSPVERGIVLFEAARQAMQRSKEAGQLGPLHEAHHVNPPELVLKSEEELPEYAYLD